MEIYKLIKKYNKIIIHGHIRPDGDCYGAQFGLKSIIKTSFPEKEVYVVGEKSEFVNFIGEIDTIEDEKYKNALVIVVDTANKDRISDQRYNLGEYVIKIDHHISDDNYGDLNWVDTNSPSCAQMITTWFKKHERKLKLSKDGAIALYTGIVTDTGRFRYRGVSDITHYMAGLLINYGADPDYIDQKLSNESLDMIALKGYVYSNYVAKDGFIYVRLTKDIIKSFNVNNEDASSVVNLLGGISGYVVWALIIEYDNEIRVRLRSSGPVINELAEKYKGGGHARAAGATLESWEELDNFSKDIIELIKVYNNENM